MSFVDISWKESRYREVVGPLPAEDKTLTYYDD